MTEGSTSFNLPFQVVTNAVKSGFRIFLLCIRLATIRSVVQTGKLCSTKQCVIKNYFANAMQNVKSIARIFIVRCLFRRKSGHHEFYVSGLIAVGCCRDVSDRRRGFQISNVR